jgi:outer membrane protein
MRLRQSIAVLLWVSTLSAQESPLLVEQPKTPIFVRPYQAPTVPPIRLSNSDRVRSLVRAGRIYITVQDAIALAIENNLDLEVERYGTALAEWGTQRSQAGGLLRGVPSGAAQNGQVASGQGVV